MGKSTINHAVVLALLTCVSCGTSDEQDPWQTYEAPSGLFHLSQPRGWSALAHEDGAGVTFYSSPGAAQSQATDAPLDDQEVTIDVTLMPPELLPALFVDVSPQAEPEALAEALLSTLSTKDGGPIPEPQRLDTGAGRAWVVWSPLAERRGAFVVLPTEAGTIITSTILVGDQIADAKVEEHITDIVGSLQLDVEPQQVLEALALPPIYPI